jgi:formamidopyrimidine-DNA glycosylase
VQLDTGETLIVHLGMSGRMLVGGRLLGEFHHDIGAAPVRTTMCSSTWRGAPA